jgi:hypothetical protein
MQGMGENIDPLAFLQGEITREFQTLAGRINDAYNELELLAHADQTRHTDTEMLWIEAESDELPAKIYLHRSEGWVYVENYDRQGEPLEYHVVNTDYQKELELDDILAPEEMQKIVELLGKCLTDVRSHDAEIFVYLDQG